MISPSHRHLGIHAIEAHRAAFLVAVLLAGAALALLPSVLAFLAFQRQFVQGLTSGAIKG